MEIVILGIFGLTLLGCLFLDKSILLALVIGFVLFFSYGLVKKFSFREVLLMAFNGIKKVKNILFTFMLIGMLTALWRASGTIAVIICYCSWMIKPAVFLLVSFLLNCLVSFLTGTSFGTVATMGVICMTMGATMKINPVLAAGSIMSGIFFGDRCSPVSTSALLVSELTQTDIFENIKQMMKIAMVPFGITCMIYLLAGLFSGHSAGNMDVRQLFASSFQLHWIALLPAGVILILSVFRVKVKTTMAVSIVTAALVCYFIQQMSLGEIGRLLIWGFQAKDVKVGEMLKGGGVISMVRVAAIVCLSSSYSGIFEGTHMLDGIQEQIAKTRNYISPFGGILGVSIVTSMISCNQTLSIMLTNQLCEILEPDQQKRAIDLEDSPVLVAPLIPWSIAGAVPMAAIGASPVCLLAACYLYLVPLWHLLGRGTGSCLKQE